MPFRLVSLLVASSIIVADPAMASNPEVDTPVAHDADAEGTWRGEWEGEWDDETTWSGAWNGTYTDVDGAVVEARYSGTFVGESEFISEGGRTLYRYGDGWRERRRQPYRAERRSGVAGRLGYSPAQRADWIDHCRASHRLHDIDDRQQSRQGSAIGGVVGAIGGGLIGNRIAGRGDRLAGTAIGAGIGALAGAAIGRELSSDQRSGSYFDAATEYCEAYLQGYEAQALTAYRANGIYGYPSSALTWVKVPILRERSAECECVEVVEEVITTQVARPRHGAAPNPKISKRVRHRKIAPGGAKSRRQ